MVKQVVIISKDSRETAKVVEGLSLSKGEYIISKTWNHLCGLHGHITFIFTKSSKELKDIGRLREVAKETLCNSEGMILFEEI